MIKGENLKPGVYLDYDDNVFVIQEIVFLGSLGFSNLLVENYKGFKRWVILSHLNSTYNWEYIGEL